ncbi:MAG: hypothetical protein K6F26_00510 [Lachnospiraceae bacterium]|nr:hypothetical protein [Lachnospiraceae bacterium]
MGHLFKKLTVWTLCLAMAVGMLPGLARGAMADEPDAGASTGIAWNEEKGYYEISSYAGLLTFADIVNSDGGNPSANAILLNDIDASASDTGSTWTPIGTISNPYTGTFDGQGKIVKTLTTKDTNAYYIGLFGYVGKSEITTGSVKNVGLIEGSITGRNAVGGVVGANFGTVSNCYNTGTVFGKDSVGGVVGDNEGTVTNCYNTGGVSGSKNVGGVVGRLNIGGTTSNSYNTGAVSGNSNVGGVAGDNSSGEVSDCHNTGKVTGSSHVGGVAGYNERIVSNCYNTGDVEGRLNDVGGVVGYNEGGTVSNCYNTGKVEGRGDVGGVAGYNYISGEVSNCYNTGAVSGSRDVGGVAGDNKGGTVSNCYYNKSICQTGAINGSDNEDNKVIGLTTLQMTGENALSSNMDLSDSIWLTKAHGGSDEGQYYLYYPQLKGFNYKADGKPETDSTKISSDNWPAKVEVKVTWDDSAPYTYDGSEQKPTVTKITVGDDTIPEGTDITYSVYTEANWEEATIGEPTSPGQYKMEYSIADEKGTKYFTILKPREDYSVTFYYKPFNDDSYSEANECINAGDYKASIFFLVPIEEDEVVKYVPGHGDTITKEFTILQRELTIQAASESWKYDGAPHKNNAVMITEGSLVAGDELSATATRAVTFVSDTKEGNNPVSDDVKVMRGTEDVTENYKINKIAGTLTITPATIIITADSASKEYDGTALSKDAYEKTDLVSGDSIESITIAGSQTVVGSSDNVPSASVIKNAADQDVTSNYDITYANGTLEVTKKAITITAGSNTKEYDGTALTKDSVSAEGLATGDKIESITVTGSQTVVGKSDNTPSEAKIVNAAGEDVTKCYEITYAKGTLEVTKKALTITADSDTKVYDETALSKDSYTFAGLANGDAIKSVTIAGSQTMKGSSDNVPSAAKIVNAKGEDVTACYEITYKNGTLTVTAPQAPKLADDQKPAPKQDLKEDGKEQVLVLDPAKLPEGYTIEYSTDGGKTWKAAPTGTRSGEYTIEVKYTADGNHTDFFGDTLKVMIQGVYNKTESDGDWTKGSGKTYTFRIKKAFNDEVCFDNLTGVFVDGKQAQKDKDYTAAKGSTIIRFASDYLETLSVGEHMIRVVFKDGEILLPLKILEAVATPTPAVDATPVTGDTANPFLFVALVLMSMAGAAVIMERKRHSTGI